MKVVIVDRDEIFRDSIHSIINDHEPTAQVWSYKYMQDAFDAVRCSHLTILGSLYASPECRYSLSQREIIRQFLSQYQTDQYNYEPIPLDIRPTFVVVDQEYCPVSESRAYEFGADFYEIKTSLINTDVIKWLETVNTRYETEGLS